MREKRLKSSLQTLQDLIAYTEKDMVLMRSHDLLTSVAQIEYDALVHDAEQAVKGLKRQRQSVVDAIKAAQATHESHSPRPDENLVLVTGLQERLRRS
jgi:hypothetical protein